MSISIDGSNTELPNDPRVSLVDHLPVHLHLHGTKKRCNKRACSACTVLVDGVRILSCVATKPWRSWKAEAVLKGRPATGDSFRAAAGAELADASPLRDNGFKVELARRTMTAVLEELAGGDA